MRIEYRLLDRAVRYALSAAGDATPRLLPAATPCAEWDLGRRLAHLGDSLDALAEGLSARSVGLGQCCARRAPRGRLPRQEPVTPTASAPAPTARS